MTNVHNSDAKVSVASNPQDPLSEFENADDENSSEDDDEDQDNDDQVSDSESPEESEDEEPTELSDQNEDKDSPVAEDQGLLPYITLLLAQILACTGKTEYINFENDGSQQKKHVVTNNFGSVLPLLMSYLSRIHFTNLLMFVIMEKCFKPQNFILLIVESLLSLQN